MAAPTPANAPRLSPEDLDAGDGWKRYVTWAEQERATIFPEPVAGPYRPISTQASQSPLELAPPNGCRWCGREQRGHATSYSVVLGRLHIFEQPTDEQRKIRMRAAKDMRG